MKIARSHKHRPASLYHPAGARKNVVYLVLQRLYFGLSHDVFTSLQTINFGHSVFRLLSINSSWVRPQHKVYAIHNNTYALVEVSLGRRKHMAEYNQISDYFDYVELDQ